MPEVPLDKKKQLSGAAKRAKKAAKLAGEAERRASAPPRPSSYVGVEMPPPGIEGAMEWVHKVGVRLVYDALTDPAIESEYERRRQVKDLIGVCGLTATKAFGDARLKRLEEKVYGRARSTNARDQLEDVD